MVAEALGPGVLAKHKVHAALLKLAREIRRPRSYVGYSSFVLMGLMSKLEVVVWEGESCFSLLEVYAPWALEHCERVSPVAAIPCSFVQQEAGYAKCVPISDAHPLALTSHFVGGTTIPIVDHSLENPSIEEFYAARGMGIICTKCDGDCGLDVMTLMLGRQRSPQVREKLREEISDYLMERIDEPWMHELMSHLQELDEKDVQDSKLQTCSRGVPPHPPPTAPAAAVANNVDQSAILRNVDDVDGETFEAMRCMCGLNDDVSLLSLVKSLPKPIVEEQVRLYREGKKAAVAERAPAKLVVSSNPSIM